jgi:hypothetical protein
MFLQNIPFPGSSDEGDAVAHFLCDAFAHRFQSMTWSEKTRDRSGHGHCFVRLQENESQVVFTGDETFHYILVLHDGSVYDPIMPWRHHDSPPWEAKGVREDYKRLTGKSFGKSVVFLDGPEQSNEVDCMFYALAFKWALGKTADTQRAARFFVKSPDLRRWVLKIIDEQSVSGLDLQNSETQKIHKTENDAHAGEV